MVLGKASGITVAAVLLIGVGGLAWRIRSEKDEEVEPGSPGSVEIPVGEGGALATTEDGPEIFRRAFWRHPSEEDRIHHAERREWSEAGEVRRWQWFLAVEASPSLLDDLFKQNRFRLQPSTTFPGEGPGGAPDWFPEEMDDLEIRQSPDESLVLLKERGNDLIYATGHGRGFAPGASAPTAEKPTGAEPSPGRLPRTSPPNPAED